MSNRIFLGFLNELSPAAASNAKVMEELLYEDPASAVVRARKFIEAIINEIFKIEGINPYHYTSLYDKISYLSQDGILDKEIESAFETIRLVGNKAAHDTEFNDINEALKLHKLMYNVGVWFYELYSKNQSNIPIYEHPRPPKPNKQIENIDELVEKKVLKYISNNLISQYGSEKQNKTYEPMDTETNESNKQSFNYTLSEGESYLFRELKRLQSSSQEAVENYETFSDFKDYLHVERKLQLDFEKVLVENSNEQKCLILLCGSVGDGKSHLLAYIRKNKPELFSGFEIFNDATESFSPNKDALETLEEILDDFSDSLVEENTTRKIILAINMGVLHNFIQDKKISNKFSKLKLFIEESGLFSQKITTQYLDKPFNLISFGDYHSFELTENGAESHLFKSIIHKIFIKDIQNPFYLAYKKDIENNINTIIHENYRFLQDSFVQEMIINMVIQIIIKFKFVVSVRTFLNFIADILIPDNYKNAYEEIEKVLYISPNLLFNRKGRSELLDAFYELDPINIRSSNVDELIVKIYSNSNKDEIIKEYVKVEQGKIWFDLLKNQKELSNNTIALYANSIIRTAFLCNPVFTKEISDNTYNSYLKYLYYFNIKNVDYIRQFYEDIKAVIFKWKGSPNKEYIYIDKPNSKYRIAQKLSFDPYIEHLEGLNGEILHSFKNTILLGFTSEFTNEILYLEIDYPLFKLLNSVKNGYFPNKRDEENAVKFVEFIEKLMAFGNKKKELIIHYLKENRLYKLKKDGFGTYVFEMGYNM